MLRDQKWAASTLVATTLGLGGAAHAELLAYDGFDGYTEGALDGQAAPALGFSSHGWFEYADNGFGVHAQTAGLSHAGTSDVPGAAFVDSDRAGRKLTMAFDNAYNGTIWLSALYQQDATDDTTYRSIELHNGVTEGDLGSFHDGNRVFQVGHGIDYNSQTNYGMRVNNTVVGLSDTAVSTDVHLMLLKIDLSSDANADAVTLFIDPTDLS